jgi:hypothetical protein
MSDAMPDPRPGTSRPADVAQDADGQCRGIGPTVTPDGARGWGRGVWPTPRGDAPVARPVVRDADGYAGRAAITKAATEAVMRDAADRAALARRPVATRDALPSTQVSADLQVLADLIVLLDQLRTAVAHYVGERRLAGAPIERVLPDVKALVGRAVAYEGWHDAAEALMRQVVGWTIAAFYDAPVQLQPPPEWQVAPHGAGPR